MGIFGKIKMDEKNKNIILDNARSRYESKRKAKPVSFNLETESALFEYANSLPSFSNAVKKWLAAEMNKKSSK